MTLAPVLQVLRLADRPSPVRQAAVVKREPNARALPPPCLRRLRGLVYPWADLMEVLIETAVLSGQNLAVFSNVEKMPFPSIP